MEKWLNLIETECADSSQEKRWNEWYDNIHLPEILQTPGYVAATRYKAENPKTGRGKYLCIYEIETDDISKTMAWRIADREKKDKQIRPKDDPASLVVRVSRDVLYRQISPRQIEKL